jgi:two-component system, sensor histidine kinase PdtaS
MSNSSLPSPLSEFSHPRQSSIAYSLFPRNLEQERQRYEALKAEVQALLAREEILRRPAAGDPVRSQAAQLQEFEHRVLNGLQLIVSMLVLQSRNATPEASAQLSIAAARVAALGRVHQRLNSSSGQEHVEFKEHLERLCEEISGVLFEERVGRTIVVQCTRLELPAALIMPLGLIANELITNSAKYAKGDITVRVVRTSADSHSISVLDEAPGLPPGYDPAKCRGLGMRIVLSLIKEIGGELRVGPGDNGRGACFAVTFRSAETGTSAVPTQEDDWKRGGEDERRSPRSAPNGHCDSAASEEPARRSL